MGFVSSFPVRGITGASAARLISVTRMSPPFATETVSENSRDVANEFSDTLGPTRQLRDAMNRLNCC